MGGRGGSSGSKGGGIRATSEQQRIMSNMQKAIAKRSNWTAPVFTKNKDGSISYSYAETQEVRKEKVGKMLSPEKADVYERVTTNTGTIFKDGLRKKNKPVTKDTLIKRGKRK